jgi:hypothetical protein
MGGIPRLHMVLGDGSPDPDRKRRCPGRAVHGRLDGPFGTRRCHPPHPPRHTRHVGRLSQSCPSGEDRRRSRSDQSWPPYVWFGAGWHGPGIPPIWLGISTAARGTHPADGGGGAAYRRDVDREAHDISRQVFPDRGCDPGAKAGAEAAPADHDRRRWRAAYPTRSCPPRGRLQCRW